MILTDTGPLVALLDKDDANSKICIETAKNLPPKPLLTTWPCFTEAMYLLGEVGGYRYQAELWKIRNIDKLIIHNFTAKEIKLMAILMEKYQDTPMDLADASLMVIAESHSFRRIFTLDSDFYIYRLSGKRSLDIIP